MRSWRRLFILVLALGAGNGCDPPPISDNGVVAIFGELGRGPGAFFYPRAIAAEPEGSVFVVDKTGRIQRFAPDGTFETSWMMPETSEGFPVGLAVHPDGRVFVADTHYNRVLVFDRDGVFLGGFGGALPSAGEPDRSLGEKVHDATAAPGFTLAGRDVVSPASRAEDGNIQLPTALAFDERGFIYVGEYHFNDRITKWSPDFRFVRAIGDEPINGTRLSRPSGLVIDKDQTLWVADACNHRLIRFDLDGRVLATVGTFGTQAGQMRYPYDLRLAPDGSLLVCEYEGARLQWFSTDGRSLRVWGTPGRKPGELFAPWGATYGTGGRIYIVDSRNNRVQILRP